MKKILIIITSLLLIFNSCEKILNIDIPEGDRHIVINGVMKPDSIINVQVSKSKSVLETENIEYLSSASLKLYIDGTFVEDLTYTENGNYLSTIKSQKDKEYKITADYGEMKTATAIGKIPDSVSILSITYTNTETTDGKEHHIKIKIDDPVGVDNYYFVALSTFYEEYDNYGNPTGEYTESSQYFQSSDPVFRNGLLSFNLSGKEGLVFTDESFDGLDYSLDITAGHTYSPVNTLKDGLGSQKYKVYLLSITKDLYYYIVSFNNNQVTTDDPFSQPVKVYTNVENGLGIFSGYNIVSDTITIEYDD